MQERKIHPMTPELRERWLKALAETERDKAEIMETFQKYDAAAAEETFSGWLRRTIRAGHDLHILPFETGIDWGKLTDFLAGEGQLSSDAIDKLLSHYQVKLPPITAVAESRNSGE